MSESFQNEIPKARVNIKLDLVTGNAKKKTEIPLKLLSVGDFSNGKAEGTLSERTKLNINKNNFNNVLAELNPELKLTVRDTLANDGSEENVHLQFQHLRDFEPEQVAKQLPKLRALMAMRNLLRDLKSNLLDNITFKKELELILRDPSLSEELRNELNALAPSQD